VPKETLDGAIHELSSENSLSLLASTLILV